MIKRIIADLQLDDAKFKPRAVAGFINGCKDEGQRPRHLQTGRDYYNDMLIRLYEEYDARCGAQNLVDFGELLLRTFETFKSKSELLEHYQARFRHLLIDEFQDTNTIQYAWIRLLAGPDTHVMAVGDDDQSIYAWRGARIENIHRYESDFCPVTTIRLEQNYRSTDVILRAANAVIANNTGRLGKELWTDQGAGTPIQLYAAFNEQDEARFVANRISQHVDQAVCTENKQSCTGVMRNLVSLKTRYFVPVFPIGYTAANDSMSGLKLRMPLCICVSFRTGSMIQPRTYY